MISYTRSPLRIRTREYTNAPTLPTGQYSYIEQVNPVAPCQANCLVLHVVSQGGRTVADTDISHKPQSHKCPSQKEKTKRGEGSCEGNSDKNILQKPTQAARARPTESSYKDEPSFLIGFVFVQLFLTRCLV